MIRTILLASLLLTTRTVHSLQDFAGIGTVRCPAVAAADNTTNNNNGGETCEYSYAQPGGLIACVLDCPEASVFAVASLLIVEETYLPCECTQAINCPDACTFTAGAIDSSGIFNTTATTTTTKPTETFRGFGRLACPIEKYLDEPCIPRDENCNGGDLITCLADTLGTLNITDTSISIDVSCDCVTLADCSAECTFEPGMTTTTTMWSANATGPGTLLCPAIDYAFRPCTLNVTKENCDCQPTDFWRDTLVEFAVSLPCDCAIATNCPQSCEFTTDLITDELTMPDFTGPGIVTCATEDYLAAPCRVNFVNIFDCLTESEECRLESLKNPDDIANVTDSEVSIALLCFCMTLSDCPDSCTYTNSTNNAVAMPSSPTAITPAPAVTTAATPSSVPPIASPVATAAAAPVPKTNNNSTMVTPTAPTPLLLPTAAGSVPVVQPPVVGEQQSGSNGLITAGTFSTMALAVVLLSVAW